MKDIKEVKFDTDKPMWLCKRQFRMREGEKEICFKNGKSYKEFSEKPLTLIDESGDIHELGDVWAKWFTKEEL